MQQPFPGLRESLTFEEVIKGQIQKCMDAFNDNNIDYVRSSVELLKDTLWTPDFSDGEFDTDILDLDDDWKRQRKVEERRYRREFEQCRDGCPDLVEPPRSQPDALFYKKMYMACIRLCERKGITWRQKKTDSIGDVNSRRGDAGEAQGGGEEGEGKPARDDGAVPSGDKK